MWFEILLVFILLKLKKKRPNISGIQVVHHLLTNGSSALNGCRQNESQTADRKESQ